MKSTIYCFITILILFFNNTVFAQWEKVNEIIDNNLHTIHALNEQTVLMGGGNVIVYRSENGGMDFSSTSLQPYGLNASFAFEENKQVGYFGSGCYFTFDECPGNTIYKTIDGGQNWDRLLTHESVGTAFGLIRDIEVPAPGIVFAVSDGGPFYRSVDAGETWTGLTIDADMEFTFTTSQIQFFDAENGIAVIRYHLLGDNFNRLYKTTDAGETWDLVYDTNGASLHSISNVHFTDKDKGFVCTNFGKLEMTVDGGNTWTPLTIADENEGLRSVFFPTEQTGYVSSYDNETKKARLYRTNDGGDNWAIDFEKDSTFISGFHFSDDNNGYLFSGNRTVYRRSGTTAVSSFPLAENFRVYPNPFDEFILIENDLATGNYNVEISNAIGQVQATEKIKIETTKISTKNWTPGFYFIHVKDENQKTVWSGKVIKE